MLPVVVDDDFDEGPPEEHAEQEDLDESVIPNTDLSMVQDMTDSAPSGSGQNVSAEGTAALPETVALSEKDRRKAEKQRQKAGKELAKAEKAKEAAAKLCCMCGEKADAKWLMCSCSARSHVECLAKRFLKVRYVLPALNYSMLHKLWMNAPKWMCFATYTMAFMSRLLRHLPEVVVQHCFLLQSMLSVQLSTILHSRPLLRRMHSVSMHCMHTMNRPIFQQHIPAFH